jgi:toxin CcdB
VGQFQVYRNRNPASQKRYPLLLDVQSDLLEPLASRVVIPLSPIAGGNRAAMKTLTPMLRLEGKDYLALTPQLAGIALAELGVPVADASVHRDAVVAALDLLISGF